MAINGLQIPQIGTITPDITPQLSQLVSSINQGQKQATLADLGRALANGTIDYKQAAAKVASLGDLSTTMGLLKMGQEQDASKAFGNSLSTLYGGSGQPQPSVPAASPSAATVPNDGNALPGQAGMNITLADRTQDFIQDNPGTSLTSGVRTPQQQAALYADRANNPNPVAAPGTSLHEKGLAADIGGMTPEQRAQLPQYGLSQPVANDPVHVQLAEGVSAQSAAGPSQQTATISPRAIALIKSLSIPGISAAQRDVGGKLLAAELDQSKLPDAVKQYLFAKSQGYQGTLVDFKTQLAAAGKTEVNVDTQGQNAFAKAGGQSIAKRFEKLSEEGDTASQDLALVGQLRDLGQQIKTGAPAAIQGALAKWGIKVGDNVGAVEAYGAIVDKLTPQQRVPGSGATSDYEGRMFKNSLPTLMKTPQGNEIIQNTLAGLAQTKIERAKIAEAALAGDLTPAEALKQLRALPNAYDNFKKFQKSGFKADPNAPASAQPSQQSTPPIRGAKLAPDGNYYVPDPNRPGKYLQVVQ
jgi:hypothetical protein